MWLIGVYGSKKIQTCQLWYHPWLTNNFWGSFRFSNYVSIDFQSYIPATFFSLPGLFIITNFLYDDLQATNMPSGKKFVVPFLSDEMSVPPVIWTVHYKLHSASQWMPTRKIFHSFRLSAVMQMNLATWAVLYIFIYKKWHCECKLEI
jgi:hypothetical protein